MLTRPERGVSGTARPGRTNESTTTSFAKERTWTPSKISQMLLLDRILEWTK